MILHPESGWEDLRRAKEQTANEFDPGPVEGPDGEPLQLSLIHI